MSITPITEKRVLDVGLIALMEYMGSDLQVVNSARISYNKRHDSMLSGDDKLINFLMRERHGTPFESLVMTFHIKCPITVAREWMRHRIGSFNEVSGRYVKLEFEHYIPKKARKQTGKPGNYVFEEIEDEEINDEFKTRLAELYNYCYSEYSYFINELGIAKELARHALNLGLYTNFYWTVNARSLMNFISLRGDDKAMLEIRQYAVAIEEIFETLYPITYKCFAGNGRRAP